MKKLSTTLLAGAFALATTAAFAQINVGAGSSTSGGAAVGGNAGSTNLNSSTGAKANVGGNKASVGADASGNAAKSKKSTTTGSGTVGVGGSVK